MNIKNIVIFIVGCGAGAIGATMYLKDKYEKIAETEIASVKEVYGKTSKKKEEIEDEDPIIAEKKETSEKPNIIEYAEKIQNEGYDYSGASKKPEVKTNRDDERPRVIKPEEYGDKYEHDLIEFTYYADGTLTDDGDEPIEARKIDEIVGVDFMEHFDEFEEDSVFIRNDRLKCDYQIIRVPNDYYPE